MSPSIRKVLTILLVSVSALTVCGLIVLKLKSDPQQVQRVRDSYLPVNPDSTFEFTVEQVSVFEDTALVFGLVTKGVVHEGYRLRLIRADGSEKECVCKVIAGMSRRLTRASTQFGEENVGLWLDLPPQEVKQRDRLISFDTPAAARQVTPAQWEFSLRLGVRKTP